MWLARAGVCLCILQVDLCGTGLRRDSMIWSGSELCTVCLPLSRSSLNA